MKTPNDPRHIKRVKIIKDLFAWDFHKQNQISQEETLELITHLPEIDGYINSAATAWPVEKINKIDLSILRLSVWELLYKKDVPVKVVVDEAVELAKKFGSDSSASFINGVLGKLIADLHLD